MGLAKLGAIEDCADNDALRAIAPLPRDPDKRARIRDVNLLLAQVQTDRVAAKRESAQESACQALAEAKEIGYEPLVVKAQFWCSRLKYEWPSS